MAKRKSKKSYFQYSFWAAAGITAVILLIPVIMLLLMGKSQNNVRSFAASQNDLYGISAGASNLTSLQLQDIKTNLHAQWIRVGCTWSSVQQGGPTSWDWTYCDDAVNNAVAAGLKPLVMLGFTPAWARIPSCTTSDKCEPANPADFANFASAVATRYLGKAQAYEIWNEENATQFWSPAPNPIKYTALLQQAYTKIKQADPSVTILTGGTSPGVSSTNGNYSTVDWAKQLYANGAKGYFDVMAAHPYCFWNTSKCPTVNSADSGWSQMASLTKADTTDNTICTSDPCNMYAIMTANGDGAKKMWVTEFGAATGGYDPSIVVSEAQQAQMVTDAYTLFRSYSWSGPLFWYTYIDPCTTSTDGECYFGLVRPDNSHKPAYTSYQTLAGTTPTLSPSATPVPASVTVTNLTESGTSRLKSSTVTAYLSTTGSMTVPYLTVAVRNTSGANYDFPMKTNVQLTGKQTFLFNRTFPTGNYTYWTAYYFNGTWVDLSPKKTFTIK